MEYIRNILKFLADSVHQEGMITFEHQNINEEVQIITVHATPDGMIVLTILSPEEYSMVMDIVELSGKSIELVIREFDVDGIFPTMELDPKNF